MSPSILTILLLTGSNQPQPHQQIRMPFYKLSTLKMPNLSLLSKSCPYQSTSSSPSFYSRISKTNTIPLMIILLTAMRMFGVKAISPCLLILFPLAIILNRRACLSTSSHSCRMTNIGNAVKVSLLRNSTQSKHLVT